ncbi:uncharacterized protein LOC110055982 [Orbicella faveolata]|uniref:uncharacterized protein LOC110055982 n=1 Tax=Orbicella faveolata TaxID=48498 RepID=UPI0009E57D0F|nr:uncharacterized protein LOC110055982 [Orbicella faveolata]
MALPREISRLKAILSPACKSLFVFKGFVIQCVRSLSLDERKAFRHWCLDIIPRSKLDVDLSDDGEMYRLIEFLGNDGKLSFTNFSLLRNFLSIVRRFDILEELERVELRICVASIMEDYIVKFVYGFREGVCIKMAGRYTNIVEFLRTTREGNQELISSILEVSRQVNDSSKMLEVLDNMILDLQLSWSTVMSSLVIMGELCASFSPVDVAEKGCYLCLLSETRASEFLTVWMLENGGLKAFDELIRKKQDVTSNGAVLSSIEDSLRESIELLGNRIHI